jgi:hypothetical protein
MQEAEPRLYWRVKVDGKWKFVPAIYDLRRDECAHPLGEVSRFGGHLDGTSMEVLKVIESGIPNQCDFCGEFFTFLIPINDGAWAICPDCYASTEIKGEEE